MRLAARLATGRKILKPMTQLRRASVHEAAHCVAALSFSLPVRCVFINDDGSGGCGYARRLGPAEASAWTTTAYAGPAAEFMVFGDAKEDGDLLVIETMLQRLRLEWNDGILAEYRHTARLLVEREYRSIEVLADALLCHRRLTGDGVAMILSVGAGSVPIVGAPVWIS